MKRFLREEDVPNAHYHLGMDKIRKVFADLIALNNVDVTSLKYKSDMANSIEPSDKLDVTGAPDFKADELDPDIKIKPKVVKLLENTTGYGVDTEDVYLVQDKRSVLRNKTANSLQNVYLEDAGIECPKLETGIGTIDKN